MQVDSLTIIVTKAMVLMPLALFQMSNYTIPPTYSKTSKILFQQDYAKYIYTHTHNHEIDINICCYLK